MSARSFVLLGAALSLAAVLHAPGTGAEKGWRKTVIDPVFRAEGAAIADFNGDGRMDILAGSLWYESPTWKPHAIRKLGAFNRATGYSDCFLCFARDVNGDAFPDAVLVGFPGQTSAWYQNPGRSAGEWKEHVITESACNESPVLADVDGDRTPELVTPHAEKRMCVYRIQNGDFKKFVIGADDEPGCKRFSHGLGVGDVSGDGRPDILCTDGYYEGRPLKDGALWKFVRTPIGPACAQMYVEDLDRDGDGDVISSSAHGIGVWWHEQISGPTGPRFQTHVIDETFSQSHSMMRADLDGDGRQDYVTGKRFWAHGPKGDVLPNHPSVLYSYSPERGSDGDVRWTRRLIDDDSGVGTGFQIGDVDGDGRPDIATANKRGVFLLTQSRPEPIR